jgi:hypothetical protein
MIKDQFILGCGFPWKGRVNQRKYESILRLGELNGLQSTWVFLSMK